MFPKRAVESMYYNKILTDVTVRKKIARLTFKKLTALSYNLRAYWTWPQAMWRSPKSICDVVRSGANYKGGFIMNLRDCQIDFLRWVLEIGKERSGMIIVENTKVKSYIKDDQDVFYLDSNSDMKKLYQLYEMDNE